MGVWSLPLNGFLARKAWIRSSLMDKRLVSAKEINTYTFVLNIFSFKVLILLDLHSTYTSRLTQSEDLWKSVISIKKVVKFKIKSDSANPYLQNKRTFFRKLKNSSIQEWKKIVQIKGKIFLNKILLTKKNSIFSFLYNCFLLVWKIWKILITYLCTYVSLG